MQFSNRKLLISFNLFCLSRVFSLFRNFSTTTPHFGHSSKATSEAWPHLGHLVVLLMLFSQWWGWWLSRVYVFGFKSSIKGIWQVEYYGSIILTDCPPKTQTTFSCNHEVRVAHPSPCGTLVHYSSPVVTGAFPLS
jgi:hypothetical protein